MGRREDEDHLFGVVSGALRRWLDKARAKVMAPWEQHKIQPDPTGIYATQDVWNAELETILTTIGQIAMHAWNEATNVPPVSRHAFIQASLAQTENFLVRIPDETYHLVFAELSEGVNAGETLEQLALRVDRVLTFTGSERWPNRARVIAQTETTRAYGAGSLAAGMEQSRVTGRILTKTWVGRVERERATHLATNGTKLPLFYPFRVGDDQLMFPGDPSGSPENVINCRCSLVIGDEEVSRG